MEAPGSSCQQKQSPCVWEPELSLWRGRLIHLLQGLAHCVLRRYLFLEDVFLLFLQLFLITSFGHSIPKKRWQRQRCKEGKDKALVGTILHTIFPERELFPRRTARLLPLCDKKAEDARPERWGWSPHTVPELSGKPLNWTSISSWFNNKYTANWVRGWGKTAL